MENKLQMGFDLIGKVFGKRLVDVGVFFLLSLVQNAAIIFPTFRILGADYLQKFGDPFNRPDLSNLGIQQLQSLLGSVLTALLVIVVVSLVVKTFIDGFRIALVKHAFDDSIEYVSAPAILAYSNWLRLIGLAILTGFLVIACAVGGLLAIAFIAAISQALGILLLVVAFGYFIWWLIPLFIFAPMQVMLTKDTVTLSMSMSLSNSKKYRGPLFLIVLCVGIVEFVLSFLIGLTKVPYLSTIILIPLPLITSCLAYPYYLEYIHQFETPANEVQLSVSNMAESDSKDESDQNWN